jgi:hypothetical protein
MTSPDGYTPDGAVSETGLSVFAKKTQAEWQAEQLASARSGWLGAQTGFDNVLSKIPIVGDILEILTGIPDADPNDLGSWVNNLKRDVAKALGGLGKLIAGVGGTIVEDVTDFVTNTWNNVKKGWEHFFDGTFGTYNTIGIDYSHVRTAANYTSSKANTADATASRAAVTADTAQSNLSETNKAVYNGFYDSGGTGTSTQVQTTIAAMKSTVNDVKTNLTAGWTVDTILADGTVWTNPGNITLMWVVCFGGGAKGNNGSGSSGGAGGLAGDYVAQQINPSLLPSTVTCTVGPGSTTSKTVTAFGSILSTTSETPGYIGSPLGYFASVSFPGDGGNGGTVTGGPTANAGSAGTAGWSASGGTGGTASNTSSNATGGTGGAGSNAPSVNISAYSGGAGGGGGGAAYSSASKSSVATGGAGGAGGFPGGGGGGGGGASIASGTGNSAVQGTGANGGNGAIFLIYQKAFT